MGITAGTLDFLIPHIGHCEGIKMLELGNQILFFDPFNNITAKEYFTMLGVDHTSIDWNGQDGAVKMDMSKPITGVLTLDSGNIVTDKNFDVITNFGFTEHVEVNQYQCWLNIHNILKIGGKCISELPGQPHFTHHEHTFYYLTDFFQQLASICGYKLIHNESRWDNHDGGGFVTDAVFEKTKEEFITPEQFKILPIMRN